MAFEFAGFVGREAFPEAFTVGGFDARGSQKCPGGKEPLVTAKSREKLVFDLAVAAAGGDDVAFWVAA
jgi:hypothetical protein